MYGDPDLTLRDLTMPLKGQRSTYNHYLNNLVDLESTMLYTKIQTFLALEKIFSSVFYHILGMVAISINGAEPY